MLKLGLFENPGQRKRILAIGAHADDIEIGCGGTVLRLASENKNLEVVWAVFCATPEREVEARASAETFLAGVESKEIIVHAFRDGFLPYAGESVKNEFEILKRKCDPDVILTHYRDDRHQDHRLVSDLTWNTWRNHLILEYEIPKYDGDFGSPNMFSNLSAEILERKVELVLKLFQTQVSKHWFTADLLRATARLRGMESVAPEGFSEAFYSRKACL